MILFRAPRGSAPGLRERSSNSGLLSIRFGDDEWWYGRERRGARREGIAGAHELDAGRLHLVTQIGDSFERAYPRVRVLAHYGRHLLVDLAPATAERIAQAKETCFRVEAITGDVEVFRRAEPSASRRTGKAQAFADAVSTNELSSTVKALAAIPTRHSTGTGFLDACAFAESKLKAAGYTTSRMAVKVGAKTSANVIAEKRGTAANRQVVVVTAHLDSVNLAGGASAKAPGADDNASGAAGVLEIARVLAAATSDHDLRFLLFGGEEQGLLGSTQYVASLAAAERKRIAAVVNMDMIGTRNGTRRGVLLEGANASKAILDALSAAAAAYTTLEVTTSLHPFNSDHVPFLDAGIPAVLTIEAGDASNHDIHGPNDTVEKIDPELLTAIVRMNAGFVAERAAARMEEPMATTNAATGKLSGRYEFNGGVALLSGRGFADRDGNRRAALRNTGHALDAPVFTTARAAGTRLTLHIDVDGIDPLQVVSGAVAEGTSESHFVGRATQTITASGVRLAVKDFSLRWPGTTKNVTKATIDVTDSTLTGVVATATFTAGSKTFGPFAAKKVSPWFREVEVDVDREAGCAEVEPVSTTVHPDRPADLASENLTLESAFAKAGIRITRASDAAVDVPTSDAGSDHRWTDQELHDSMVLHWEAFANRPQWKMWIFMANRHADDGMGGVMFDGDIDEPGGVDRQGTALFTRCPLFHTPTGQYIVANPPADEAIKRELFFNLIHETGHAFNLAHSFQKSLEMGSAWNAPSWAPVHSNNQSLSWLNYPDRATPSGGAGLNASWFYKRFRFRFDDDELLFLRHAPAADVEMGGQAWFDHHGRVARESLDPRLRLEVRHRKQIAERGEPILCELKLKNVGAQPVAVHRNLDPSEGFVQIAITSPSGKRRPYVSVSQARRSVAHEVLQPGASLYAAIDLTMGIYGFPFKEPGAYRIEASYTNLDGSTAAAVAQIYVRPAASYDAVPVVDDLFRADVGRVLLCEGTEVLGEVNERLAHAEKRLAETIGAANPVSLHLRTTRYQPLARRTVIVDADGSTRRTDYEPDRFVSELAPALIGQVESAADTMGHIWFRDVVDQYTDAALATNQPDKAYQAQNLMHALFAKRGVVANVCADIESRAEVLKKMATKSVAARKPPQLRLR